MPDTADRQDLQLDHLLHPAATLDHPMNVVADPHLSNQEKRAILASWASDACAVEAAPQLRRSPSAVPVRFDDIIDALKRLDGEATGPCHPTVINRARRWKALYRNDRSGRSLFA